MKVKLAKTVADNLWRAGSWLSSNVAHSLGRPLLLTAYRMHNGREAARFVRTRGML